MASTLISRSKWIIDFQAVIESVLLLLLLALLLWKGVIPGWRNLNTDFPNYYVVARLIREHYCLDRIYDWLWFQRAADHFALRHQVVGFLGLTPFSAFPIVPLSWLPALAAKRLWIVCNVALLAASIELLRKQTSLDRRRAWIIALLAIIPLRLSFLFGQMHILVLALLIVAYVSHIRGWQVGSGCCIALAAALKIYPIFFCVYFLIKRRWKAFGAAILCISLCLIFSYLVTGQEAMRAYLFEQLPRLLQGESQSPFIASLTSSSALFHRLFLYEPELNPHPLIASVRLYAILYPMWQALLVGLVFIHLRSRFQDNDREAIEWSMFLCLLMFLSSAPASYQFVVLIAAAMPTMSVLIGQQQWKAVLVYLSLYFLACNVRAIHLGSASVHIFTPIFYLTLWCGVGLLLLYCVLLKLPATDTDWRSIHFFRAPTFRAGAVVLCLWILGSRSAWSHLKDIEASGVWQPRDDAYLRIDPVTTDRGLLYVTMLPEGYRVLSADVPFADAYPGLETAADQLSFATDTSGKDLWIETASDRGSWLVHVISGERVPTCAAVDGEDPVLSQDKSRLAFLREDKGRGSLWVVELRDCASSGSGFLPARVTSSLFDVRTLAAGPDGTFLMSAVYQGRERIFTVSPGAAPQLLAEGNGELDSPALSLDGKLLVVRRLISNRWQLASFDLSLRMWKQLTHGDCNAYTPSWKDNYTLLYATDCMRGMGLTTLASLKINR